jgi:acetyl-CoA carboxylase biotin carboxyl carrier protein
MDPQLIKTLIDALAASDLKELEYSRDGTTLRLIKRPGGGAVAEGWESAPIPVPVADSVAADTHVATESRAATLPNEVCAPVYGIVHLAPSPGMPPFVQVGDPVSAGQTLCLMEAMKVFSELRADRDGMLQGVLVEAGQEVEAGQALFRLYAADTTGV